MLNFKIKKMNLKESDYNQIIENLIKYFDVKPVGSYLLYKNDLLSFKEINDIDVFVSKEKEKNIYEYLSDLGYKQTIKEGKQVGYKNGRSILEQLPQGDFKKENSLKIDVIISSETVWSIPTLIAEKFRRSSKSDISQLLKIMAKKSDVDLLNLLHHRDTTIGLFAIDRNPTEVDYDWILENSFQIK